MGNGRRHKEMEHFERKRGQVFHDGKWQETEKTLLCSWRRKNMYKPVLKLIVMTKTEPCIGRTEG